MPYVNNVPHLGTLLGSGLCGDVYVRFLRLKNEDCIYIGGADEYGTPVTVAAKKEGVEPQELANKYFDIQTQVFKNLDISFDKFTRTTSKEHTKIALKISNSLEERKKERVVVDFDQELNWFQEYYYQNKNLFIFAMIFHRFKVMKILEEWFFI